VAESVFTGNTKFGTAVTGENVIFQDAGRPRAIKAFLDLEGFPKQRPSKARVKLNATRQCPGKAKGCFPGGPTDPGEQISQAGFGTPIRRVFFHFS
jgi:hypothetical protein